MYIASIKLPDRDAGRRRTSEGHMAIRIFHPSAILKMQVRHWGLITSPQVSQGVSAMSFWVWRLPSPHLALTTGEVSTLTRPLVAIPFLGGAQREGESLCYQRAGRFVTATVQWAVEWACRKKCGFRLTRYHAYMVMSKLSDRTVHRGVSKGSHTRRHKLGAHIHRPLKTKWAAVFRKRWVDRRGGWHGIHEAASFWFV